MRVPHPERFAEYCRLEGDAKESVSVSVPLVKSFDVQYKEGPLCLRVDAAIQG
jgi:hypothetical protein